MNEIKFKRKHLFLLSLLLVLALFVAACGQDEPATVTEPVGANEAAVIEVTVVATAAADEVDAVSTTVMTDTLVDTDVITEIEVLTQTDIANIRVVTEVMTDTNVTIDTASNTDSAVTTETANVNTGQASAVILIADGAGNAFLGDPLAQQPIFGSANEGLVVDERFEPIAVGEETIFGEGLDRNLFGEIDRDGMRQLTYNNHPLYRFTGEEGEDWRSSTNQLGLSPLTAAGEIGEFSE